MTPAMSESAYISGINELLQGYLTIIPAEAQRIPVLISQLADSDLSLTSRNNMTGHLTASALVFDYDCAKVLLIHHKSLKRWLQPGGHLDHNEAPEDGARRELLEETGLKHIELMVPQKAAMAPSCRFLCPFDVDTHEIPANPARGEGEHLHHDFQYIYRSTSPDETITLQEEEVAKFKWVSLEELESGAYGRRLSRVASKLIEQNYSPVRR
jgi:8-oxo-dGTP pyrophosphatase MutT (NUDIX family)